MQSACILIIVRIPRQHCTLHLHGNCAFSSFLRVGPLYAPTWPETHHMGCPCRHRPHHLPRPASTWHHAYFSVKFVDCFKRSRYSELKRNHRDIQRCNNLKDFMFQNFMFGIAAGSPTFTNNNKKLIIQHQSIKASNAKNLFYFIFLEFMG